MQGNTRRIFRQLNPSSETNARRKAFSSPGCIINLLIFGPFFYSNCTAMEKKKKIAFMFQQIESYQPITIAIELLTTFFSNDVLFSSFCIWQRMWKVQKLLLLVFIVVCASMVISLCHKKSFYIQKSWVRESYVGGWKKGV